MSPIAPEVGGRIPRRSPIQNRAPVTIRTPPPPTARIRYDGRGPIRPLGASFVAKLPTTNRRVGPERLPVRSGDLFIQFMKTGRKPGTDLRALVTSGAREWDVGAKLHRHRQIKQMGRFETLKIRNREVTHGINVPIRTNRWNRRTPTAIHGGGGPAVNLYRMSRRPLAARCNCATITQIILRLTYEIP